MDSRDSSTQRDTVPADGTPNDGPAARGSFSQSTDKKVGASHPSSATRSESHPTNNNTPDSVAAAASERQAQSQPMTTTTSASSHASTKDNKTSDMAAAAAPYGTRSRNRPGTSRINYAEDAELMDFEMTQPVQNGTSHEPVEKSTSTRESRDSTPAATKKSSAAAATGGWAPVNSTTRDSAIPGTSTFTTNSTTASVPAPAKRRKTHATTNGNSSAASHHNSSRKAAQSAISANASRETNMLTFEKSKAQLKNGKLEADDGTILSVNDYVYLVCEPPGEPYYLCRIMEFLRAESDKANSPVDSMRVNWFYRPRDVQRYNNDTRLVYGTMHSDICPLTSLRGRCQILHRSEVGDLDEYRKQKDSFWFNQIFDRFIHRWYEVIPVSQVINVPERVKRALDERWKFVVVETSRVKELTSAVKTCKRCQTYCASNDSVGCAVCQNSYHMNCVNPPLQKKPSRGFAWACGPCSRAQERKLEARRTPIIGDANAATEDEEIFEEEEEDPTANADTTAPSPNGSDAAVDMHPATQAEIALAQMWPMRYLGIHARVEDVLQYDDRAIYPRASSRLGPRHQANTAVWHGRPVELIKPAEIKRRYVKAAGHKKDTKLSKETVAALEADRQDKAKRPKWVQDEPPGYVRRGEDIPNKDSKNSAKLLFRMPPRGEHSERGLDDAPDPATEQQVDEYMARARTLASHIGVEPYNTNFLDKALQLFSDHNYDADAALKQLKKVDRRKDLKEPELTKEELKKFGEGVAKYGSEIRLVRLHVGKTLSHADAVRFYYLWKKKEGKEIWSKYGGRKGKNRKADPDTKLQDDIAHDQDDSAFDGDKAERKKRGFQCKFCSARHSRQWRRAPGVTPGQTVPADGRSKDKGSSLVVALCQRCANLWRRYAIKFEGLDDISKKVAMGGMKALKRKVDEELLNELMAANDPAPVAQVEPSPVDLPPVQAEPAKKRQKLGAAEKDKDGQQAATEPAKKKQTAPAPLQVVAPPPPPKQPTPPPQPAQPKMRILPCAICQLETVEGDQLMCCRECRLTVHRHCFGIESQRIDKWTCDMCKNDRKEHVSYNYSCVLCPIICIKQELVEQPKISHKKKTERDRERERLEKELVEKLKFDYQQAQRERGRPELPREPLKRTADNNWAHLQCAVWMPETRFSDANTMNVIEGIGAPTMGYESRCSICSNDSGACVTCHSQGCHVSFHVTCALYHKYPAGFDVTPVKGSRRDTVPVVSLGHHDKPEIGSLTPAIWCKDHAPKTNVHGLWEKVNDSDLNVLQTYVRNYKQADTTMTGTARRILLADLSAKALPPTTSAVPNRRISTTTGTVGSTKGRRASAGDALKNEDTKLDDEVDQAQESRKCERCSTENSPKWWDMNEKSRQKESTHEVPDTMRTSQIPNGPDRIVATTEQDGPSSLANGISSQDQPMPDAPAFEPKSTADRSDTTVHQDNVHARKPIRWLCHKCHHKKVNGLNEPEQFAKPTLGHASVRSPATESMFKAPTPWAYKDSNREQHAPPLSSWAPTVKPTIGTPAPAPLSNGVSHSPQLSQHNAPHHQPYHTPPLHQHPPPGYAPPVHPGSHPSSIRNAFAPAHPPHGPPGPIHISNPPVMSTLSNGLASPHIGIQSPTHPPLHHQASTSRHSESPFPPTLPPYHAHGSPHMVHNRPTTPRESLPPIPASERVVSGASASPSLRHLLH